MNLFSCALLASSILIGYLATSRSSIDEEYGYENKIDFISVEPMKHSLYSSRMTIKYSFSSTNNQLIQVSIKVVNPQYVRGKVIFSQMLRDKAATVIYDYPQTYSNISRNDVYVFQLSGPQNDEVSISSKVYSPQNVVIKDENSSYETPENIAIYRRGEGITYQSEKYIFSNLKQEYVLGKYWGVNLYGLLFNYVAPKYFELTYDNPRLIIESREGALTKIGEERGMPNWRYLSLSLDKDEKSGKLNFHPKDHLYVNPITLDMASYPIENYIETKYLFFPRPKEDVETYIIRFMVDNLGANNYQFAYEFSVSITSDLYGNCNDSSYCLNMEDSVPDLDLGTLISE